MRSFKWIYLLPLFFFAACKENDKTKETVTVQPAADTSEKKVVVATHAPADITTWPRKNAAEMGCIFESVFSYRDPVFNCSKKNYVNHGDPCKQTKAYYEGPKLPDSFASKLYPGIKSILFDFEGGRLREINISFSEVISKEKIRQWFGLPDPGATLPENIMSIQYGENVYSDDKPADNTVTKWLTITGFEHMGAGDVDCE